MSQSSHIDALLKELTPQVVGAIARRFRDFSAAEDAVQEALIAAASQWPRQGVPDNPRGWLIHVASRRMTDHIRAELARRRREFIIVSQSDDSISPADLDAAVVDDDTLQLLFMCCHPSLTRSSAIALTLRAVGGLTTSEIAAAYFVPEATMAQRISRAKATIKNAGASFDVPDAHARDARLGSVLHVLYLIFSEGHTASAGDALQRADLSTEAIRLAREVRRLVPNTPEVTGLLALMLLTDARRAARTNKDGGLIPLDQQDRRLWDRAMINEGTALISEALPHGAIGTYQAQAAIAAIHDEAESTDATDWPQIVAFYDVLMRLADNPMAALNRAIAVAMVDGPTAGLALIDILAADRRLAGHYRIDAVRGHLFERAGDLTSAARHYLAGAHKTTNTPERNYLLLCASETRARTRKDDVTPVRP